MYGLLTLGSFPLLLLMLLPLCGWSQTDTLVVKTDSSAVRHQVLLRTTKGDIVVELYNDTPLHRDNFLRLVRSGYYDGNLWHRVIADFMIQTGDSTTRHAAPGATVGEYDPPFVMMAMAAAMPTRPVIIRVNIQLSTLFLS